MPRAKGQRVHLTSFRRRGRDESRQRAPPGTEFCDFAWGDLVYENVRFSFTFTNPPLSSGHPARSGTDCLVLWGFGPMILIMVNGSVSDASAHCHNLHIPYWDFEQHQQSPRGRYITAVHNQL